MRRAPSAQQSIPIPGAVCRRRVFEGDGLHNKAIISVSSGSM